MKFTKNNTFTLLFCKRIFPYCRYSSIFLKWLDFHNSWLFFIGENISTILLFPISSFVSFVFFFIKKRFFWYPRGKCDFGAPAQNSKNDRFHDLWWVRVIKLTFLHLWQESLEIFEFQPQLLVYRALSKRNTTYLLTFCQIYHVMMLKMVHAHTSS